MAGLAVAEVNTLVVALLVMASDVAISVVLLLLDVVTVTNPSVTVAELVFSGLSSWSFVLVGGGLAECVIGVSVVIGCGCADAVIVLMVKVTGGDGRDSVNIEGSIVISGSVGVDPAIETDFVDFTDLTAVLVVEAVFADTVDLTSGSSINSNTGSDLADRLSSSPASKVTLLPSSNTWLPSSIPSLRVCSSTSSTHRRITCLVYPSISVSSDLTRLQPPNRRWPLDPARSRV